MLKKIFLGSFVILFGVLGYFYFFPIYPDNDIPDSYFNTIYSDREFSDNQNGYKQWGALNNYLSENDIFIKKIHSFYTCIDQEKGNCHQNIVQECRQEGICNNLTKQNQIEVKSYVTNYFINTFETSGDKERLQEIINHYFSQLEKINEYKYLIGLNESNLFPTPILYSNFRYLNEILFYYYSLNNQETIQKLSQNYSNLVKILNKMDSQLIDSLILYTVLNINLTEIQERAKSLSQIDRKLYRDVIESNSIQKGFMKNTIKNEYKYVLLLLQQEIFNKDKLGFSPKILLFYSEKDTLNLLKRQFKSVLEGSEYLPIKLNGRNFIGRTLISSSIGNYGEQIKKENNLFQKIEDTVKSLNE